MNTTYEINLLKDTILKSTDCEKIYLFGSRAYGNPNKDSDYDFWVVLNDNSANKYEILENIYWNIAQSSINASVDVLASRKSRFEERSKAPTLEKKVKTDGVLLYAT